MTGPAFQRRHARRLLFFSAMAAVVAISSTGCPGSLEDPERFTTCGAVCTSSTPTTADVLAQILKPRCGMAGCHGGAAPAGQMLLDTDAATLRAELFSKTSSTPTCLGRPLVVPGNPDQSLLYLKLINPPPCGAAMPLGTVLPPAEQETIRAWIEGLATP